MPWIFLQSPVKSQQSDKYLYSVHLKEKTKLQIRNGGLLLDHHFIYPFSIRLFNASKYTPPDV